MEERLQFFFLSQNLMRFCFSIVKTVCFLSRGTNLHKICPKYSKIYCKSAQKRVVRQPACPPQTPLLSTSHDRAWLPRIHYGSPCPWIKAQQSTAGL